MGDKISDGGLFINIVGFINKFFNKNKDIQKIEKSYFVHLINDLKEEDEGYLEALYAKNMFDDALKYEKQRTQYLLQLKNIEEKSLEVKSFSQLEAEEADKLKNLLDSFVSLKKERNNLIYQLTSFDNSLLNMDVLKEDAISAMPQIIDAEKNQRNLRYDIGQLEGEKSALEDESLMLQFAIKFIERFNIVMVVIFVIATVFLAYASMFGNMQIFYPTTALILLASIIVTLTIIFKRKTRTELKLNVKKQNRAVELLNKKKAVYAYYSNFLNYEYKKYKVSSSNTLKVNLSDYEHYKFISGRIDSIRRIMYDTEKAIEAFLREKNLAGLRIFVEEFVNTISVEDKIQYAKNLETEKERLEKLLEELDVRLRQIWSTIISLVSEDKTKDKVIELMMRQYEKEVDNIFINIDTEENAV